MLTASCATTRKADVEFIEATPPADSYHRDPRPQLTAEAAKSEAGYENWVSDIDDWGKSADVTIWRGCRWMNTFLKAKVDCGPVPKGAEPGK